MSTQRGNWKKTGPPKHANKKAFKNNMHDTSKQTQMLNTMEVSGVCNRCKDIIDWKIKYKKYKPLTVPKKCTRCGQKAVKRAYCMVCVACVKALGICAKCGQKSDIVIEPGLSPAEQASQQSQLEQELKLLPERKRRAFLRQQASGKVAEEGATGANCEDVNESGDGVEGEDRDIDSDTMDSEGGECGEDSGKNMAADGVHDGPTSEIG